MVTGVIAHLCGWGPMGPGSEGHIHMPLGQKHEHGRRQHRRSFEHNEQIRIGHQNVEVTQECLIGDEKCAYCSYYLSTGSSLPGSYLTRIQIDDWKITPLQKLR